MHTVNKDIMFDWSDCHRDSLASAFSIALLKPASLQGKPGLLCIFR